MSEIETKAEQQNWLAYAAMIARKISQVRPLAYTSEVGESFRPIIPKLFVNTSYAISIFYVGADVFYHSHCQHKKDPTNTKQLAICTSDHLLWHSFASMIFPAATIHTAVKFSGKFLNKFNLKTYPRVLKWGPTGFGLAIIPFIIHPLDDLTDYLMNNSVRKFYHHEKKIH